MPAVYSLMERATRHSWAIRMRGGARDRTGGSGSPPASATDRAKSPWRAGHEARRQRSPPSPFSTIGHRGELISHCNGELRTKVEQQAAIEDQESGSLSPQSFKPRRVAYRENDGALKIPTSWTARAYLYRLSPGVHDSSSSSSSSGMEHLITLSTFAFFEDKNASLDRREKFPC